jgi:ADP-ribose pyrophosphatase
VFPRLSRVPEAPPPSGFRTLSEREVHHGPVVTLAVREVETPDGTVVEREVVHHPGAVAVVPVLPDGRVVLVRQYRAAVEEELLEIPAGKRDVDGEEPQLTAQRELGEEAGYEAAEMVELARYFMSPGFCDEHMILYLARGLREVETDAHGVEEENLRIELWPLAQVDELVASGELRDSKSIIGLLLARDHLAREHPGGG